MNLNGRITKLEDRTAGPSRLLVLRQDLEDRTRFTDNEGNEYREGVNWPDGEGLTVLKVVHDRD